MRKNTAVLLLIILLIGCSLNLENDAPSSGFTPMPSPEVTSTSEIETGDVIVTEEVEPSPLEISEDGCIQPVSTIAYQTNYIYGLDDDDIPFPGLDTFILPTEPWRIESYLPTMTPADGEISFVEIARSVDEKIEIWIVRTRYPDLNQFDIYLPETQSWEPSVSRYVEGTETRTSILYVLPDGSVWAKNSWNRTTAREREYYPLLSKFNEITRQFEFVDSMVDIPQLTNDDPLVEVTVDREGTFWILREGDAIYSYNPKTEATQRYIDIPEADILGEPAVDSLGNLFFAILDYSGKELPIVYKFNTETNVLEQFDNGFRLQPWPVFSDLFIDHTDRVWFGGIGWMEPNGDVYQLLQSPIFVAPKASSGFSYRYSPPQIILESSDGRIWFQAFAVGLVWLDLELGKYCWFTTYETNIVEDNNNTLWMMAENQLFRYDIYP